MIVSESTGFSVPPQNAVFIAAPYIRAAALTRFLANVPSVPELTCVTRWQPKDLALGVSEVECRRIILNRGGHFLLHPTLHAKYYRFDDEILIGSANLTMSGMGWSWRSNLEILAPPSDAFDYLAFESELLARARPISDVEFEQWASIQDLGTEAVGSTPQFAQAPDWRPVTREFENFSRAYYGRLREIPSIDEARRAQSDIVTLQLPPNQVPESLRRLVTTALLASPYASDVLRVQHMDAVDAARELATLYDLPLHLARRDMETVHNWLRELAPELLPSSEDQ